MHRKGKNTSSVNKGLLRGLWRIFRAMGDFLRQRFTVMLIPHSEKRVFNFHVNTLTILFVGLLFVVLVGGFFYFSTHFSTLSSVSSSTSETLEKTQASLDAILDEIAEIRNVSQEFSTTLLDTLNEIGLDDYGDQSADIESGGDLSSFINLQGVEAGSTRELQALQQLTATLRSSLDPLAEIRDVLRAQNDLLADIPNLWPLRNEHGHVTLEFGPNRHPKTNQWYLHKGIDIAGSIGVPVLASANGKIIESGYDRGYGNYVLIRHKYGFRTRYSHLQNLYTSEGQEVRQGEIIGTLGNTGISTGPHLDFQIILGTDVIDPSLFLKISRREFERWQGNRY